MERKVSEVHVPTGQLIWRTVLVRRVAVEIAVICRSRELEEKTTKEERTVIKISMFKMASQASARYSCRFKWIKFTLTF